MSKYSDKNFKYPITNEIALPSMDNIGQPNFTKKYNIQHLKSIFSSTVHLFYK